MFPTAAIRKSRHSTSVPTSTRKEEYQKQSLPPAPASLDDSCYGVKSMNSDWGLDADIDIDDNDNDNDLAADANGIEGEDRDEGEDIENGNNQQDQDSPEEEIGLGITPTNQTALHHWSALRDINCQTVIETEADSVSPSQDNPIGVGDTQASQTRTIVIPPSPEDITSVQPSNLEPIAALDSPYSYSHGHTCSEPSSPASFTSIPSYVASLSSLSRTSSLSTSPLEYGHGHERDRGYTITGTGTGGQDLVLPTLSLPSESLSLHMSLRKWSSDQTESNRGFGIILIGPREIVEKSLRILKDKCELVELGRGIVGLIKDDKVVSRIITGLSIDQAKDHIHQAYSSLNRLLHPDLPLARDEGIELRKLVASYASRSEWVQQALLLDDGVHTDIDDLDKFVPTITLEPITNESGYEAAHQHDHEDQPHREIVEPTPRPGSDNEQREYFAPRISSHSPSSSRDVSPLRLTDCSSHIHSNYEAERVANLLYAISMEGESDRIQASVIAFLKWRTNLSKNHQEVGEGEDKIGNASNMTSSITSAAASTSAASGSASSSSYGVGPMPTVARAQGGGEWEATLSRRIAIRRETESLPTSSQVGTGGGGGGVSRGKGLLAPTANTRGSRTIGGSGERRKRSFDREIEKKTLPLFPTIPSRGRGKGKPASGSVGLGNLVQKTFTNIKQRTRGWKGVVLACAVVVAVGWGCWISRR